MTIPADIAGALELYANRLGPYGRHLQWYPETTSTNDEAIRLAGGGAPAGTVVGADAQIAGRGRLGRTWASPVGAGLYVSVVLRPTAAAARLVTIAAGVAVADGIREASGLSPALKWPNDLYVGQRKLGGILAEAGAVPGAVSHVVVGFGINLSPAAYPPEVAARATSLEVELGRPVDRGLTLVACLAALARRIDELNHDRSSLLAAWRAYASATLNRSIEAMVGSRPVIGVAEDIDEEGALVVRTDSGRHRIIAGEVVWR